jgi:hypothetical protein
MVGTFVERHARAHDVLVLRLKLFKTLRDAPAKLGLNVRMLSFDVDLHGNSLEMASQGMVGKLH